MLHTSRTFSRIHARPTQARHVVLMCELCAREDIISTKPLLNVLAEALGVHFRFDGADRLAIVAHRLVRVLEFLLEVEFLQRGQT